MLGGASQIVSRIRQKWNGKYECTHLEVHCDEHNAVERATSAGAANSCGARLARIRDNDRFVPLPLLIHRVNM